MRTRTAFPTLLAAVGLMFLSPVAAHAHGDTVKVVVTGQRGGHVTAEITWENDKDAVDEAVAATVNAVSADGSRSLGAWRLVRDPAASPAGWTTAEVLPPGAWKVTVDVGFPALGHGELDVAVPVVDPAPATGTPATGAPTPSAPAPGSSASSAPDPATTPTAAAAQPGSASASPAQEPPAKASDDAVWWTTAGVAATALAGAAGGLLIRRRRVQRARSGSRTA
ncbi:hypothetical protein OG429_05015 [Streptomyces sp. NBC_00190]|uniref:hypothetical protein n=1 Tax=unclassified Streptomyces TaxID=2593676 RepID=UPI002E29CAFC|nr:hypothetical protein [Streptomyces sp. NBC_00190]WSZ38746.1 hypothetical protein OG239_08025 [Streptomyces sp. NBC_00868]